VDVGRASQSAKLDLAELGFSDGTVGWAALELPVHGMTLHIHHEVGSGDGLFVSYQRSEETITVTPAEIIYQRRIAVLEHVQGTWNVAETCRVFNISRTRYYQWKNVADRYGLDALVPKRRRSPQMSEATPTHVIQALLTLAVLEPTIGCRQYADRLGDQGFVIAKSTVQKHLVAHGLGPPSVWDGQQPSRRPRPAESWLVTYHRRRWNHGDYMCNRTPHEVLDKHRRNNAA
jgi:hypothetical protein